MKSKLFTKVISACVTLMLISGSSVHAAAEKKDSPTDKKGITIEYFGHSSFGISDKEGMKIVTDPYAPDTGYKFPSVSTQILTVSHDHFDHNYVAALKGYKMLINAATGRFKNDNIKIKGFSSWHDKTQGSERGANTIYTYDINNIKICHLGDLGHELSEELIEKIGSVDVLMIPVGGFFTIDSEEAIRVINSLNPKVVIPMHYETKITKVTFEDVLAPEDDFTSKLQGWDIEKVDNLKLTKQMLNTLKAKKVYILNDNQ